MKNLYILVFAERRPAELRTGMDSWGNLYISHRNPFLFESSFCENYLDLVYIHTIAERMTLKVRAFDRYGKIEKRKCPKNPSSDHYSPRTITFAVSIISEL